MKIELSLAEVERIKFMAQYPDTEVGLLAKAISKLVVPAKDPPAPLEPKQPLVFEVHDSELVVTGDFPSTKTEALGASIQKWQTIVDYLIDHPGQVINDNGDKTCALCQLYIKDSCECCPVYLNTGKTKCEGTPYDQIEDYANLRTARSEVEFLKSLR